MDIATPEKLATGVSMDAMIAEPDRLARLNQDEIYAIPYRDQVELQLEAARGRFASLKNRIGIIDRFATEQGVSEIRTIEDLGHLLLPHSTLKSYPGSIIEKGQFDRLTRWLDGFTTHDLSGLDASRCETIDDWIILLERETEIRIVHSSGTTGKLSLMPASTQEMMTLADGWEQMLSSFRDERPWVAANPRETPVLSAQHRDGAQLMIRGVTAWVDYALGGDESKVLYAYPGRMSADIISIGGRLSAADAQGEHGQAALSPRLLERKAEFEAEYRERPRQLDEFFETMVTRFKGQVVQLRANVPTVFRFAEEGLKRGIEGVFHPGSFIQGGGGLKGQTLPDDYEETIARFMGGARPAPGFGMSEAFGSFRICPAGHFHFPVWLIPYISDPVTGEQAPRTGVQTGRLGAFDLKARTLWGGSLSGDEVTLRWGDDRPCACGRIGPHIDSDIRRYSEKEGGNDKITCSGAPQAHDKALEYILNYAGGN